MEVQIQETQDVTSLDKTHIDRTFSGVTMISTSVAFVFRAYLAGMRSNSSGPKGLVSASILCFQPYIGTAFGGFLGRPLLLTPGDIGGSAMPNSSCFGLGTA